MEIFCLFWVYHTLIIFLFKKNKKKFLSLLYFLELMEKFDIKFNLSSWSSVPAFYASAYLTCESEFDIVHMKT